MKKNVIISMLAIMLFTGITKGQNHPSGSDRVPFFAMLRNLTPEQMAELQTKRMQLALNLSNDQYERVYPLALKFSTSMKNTIKELKTTPGRPDSDTIYKIQLKKLELLQGLKNQLKGILTSEQLNTWILIMARK